MSANSIAKLSVLITGDSSPLNQSMQQGAQHIKEFAHESEHGGSGLMGLVHAMKEAMAGAHASEGSLKGISHALLALATPEGAALVAAGAFLALGAASLEAANKAAEARNKIREEYDKAYEDLHGEKSGVQMEDTIGGAWKEAKEAVEDFFATMAENSGLVDVFVEAFKGIAESVKSWADYWKTDVQKAREAEVEAMKKRTDELKEAKKAQDEQRNKDDEAEKARQRQIDETRKHADQLTKSLRIPDEIYRDAIIELKSLADQGMITGETLSRGMQKARDDLEKALDTTKEMRDVSNQRIGAAERYTSAGYSAVQSARAARENSMEKDAAKTAKNSDFLKHLESIDENIKNQNTQPQFVLSNI